LDETIISVLGFKEKKRDAVASTYSVIDRVMHWALESLLLGNGFSREKRLV
jgi:hypothetical protein